MDKSEHSVVWKIDPFKKGFTSALDQKHQFKLSVPFHQMNNLCCSSFNPCIAFATSVSLSYTKQTKQIEVNMDLIADSSPAFIWLDRYPSDRRIDIHFINPQGEICQPAQGIHWGNRPFALCLSEIFLKATFTYFRSMEVLHPHTGQFGYRSGGLMHSSQIWFKCLTWAAELCETTGIEIFSTNVFF